MPAHCAAYSYTLRRTIETRKLGMTFHRFPRDYGLRRKWEAALRTEGFAANDEWVLCSDHFKPVSLTGMSRFVGLDLVSFHQCLTSRLILEEYVPERPQPSSLEILGSVSLRSLSISPHIHQPLEHISKVLLGQLSFPSEEVPPDEGAF
ncbi:THAP domain-containing protein 2-like [Amphiprion ocellaris]|uniref:THAP domain-containing protein 2-like n=1 Tax=Amphiprion ocellaris TaxID=80972 RepID=UPI00241131B2|nr:THAP domain-containing protein 2-like [Amphiprion ocellaris]